MTLNSAIALILRFSTEFYRVSGRSLSRLSDQRGMVAVLGGITDQTDFANVPLQACVLHSRPTLLCAMLMTTIDKMHDTV